MRRSKLGPDLKYIVEMNYTKSAAAKRMGIATSTLDKKCREMFGMKWDDLKAAQRAEKNAQLAKKPIGKVYYAHSYRMSTLPRE